MKNNRNKSLINSILFLSQVWKEIYLPLNYENQRIWNINSLCLWKTLDKWARAVIILHIINQIIVVKFNLILCTLNEITSPLKEFNTANNIFHEVFWIF